MSNRPEQHEQATPTPDAPRGALTPSTGWGTRDVGIAAVCAGLVLASAWWALAVPTGAGQPSVNAHPGSDQVAVAASGSRAAASQALEPLDTAAFRMPLWVAPPAPPFAPAPTKPPPEPPPPPMKWQLLAIVSPIPGTTPGESSEGAKAMVYDPDTDEVIELAAGQSRGTRTVESIDDAGVVIRSGKHTYTLSLDRPVAGGDK